VRFVCASLETVGQRKSGPQHERLELEKVESQVEEEAEEQEARKKKEKKKRVPQSGRGIT
jgi:hypothetical protein